MSGVHSLAWQFPWNDTACFSSSLHVQYEYMYLRNGIYRRKDYWTRGAASSHAIVPSNVIILPSVASEIVFFLLTGTFSTYTQLLKFIIISVAHCRLDFTINNRTIELAYKFKNISAILNVYTTEITTVWNKRVLGNVIIWKFIPGRRRRIYSVTMW